MYSDQFKEKRAKYSKCKMYPVLDFWFEPFMFDLIILHSNNGQVFNSVVKVLHREKVHTIEEFVVFYICNFVGGIKEYTHIKGVGKKTEEVFNKIFSSVCTDGEEYENETLF